MQRCRELYAIVGHALMNSSNLIVGLGKRALAVLGSAKVLVRDSANLPEARCVFFLQCRSLLQEQCEFLPHRVSLLFVAYEDVERYHLLSRMQGSA